MSESSTFAFNVPAPIYHHHHSTLGYLPHQSYISSYDQPYDDHKSQLEEEEYALSNGAGGGGEMESDRRYHHHQLAIEQTRKREIKGVGRNGENAGGGGYPSLDPNGFQFYQHHSNRLGGQPSPTMISPFPSPYSNLPHQSTAGNTRPMTAPSSSSSSSSSYFYGNQFNKYPSPAIASLHPPSLHPLQPLTPIVSPSYHHSGPSPSLHSVNDETDRYRRFSAQPDPIPSINRVEMIEQSTRFRQDSHESSGYFSNGGNAQFNYGVEGSSPDYSESTSRPTTAEPSALSMQPKVLQPYRPAYPIAAMGRGPSHSISPQDDLLPPLKRISPSASEGGGGGGGSGSGHGNGGGGGGVAKTTTFVVTAGSVAKRPRRRFEEIERLYTCDYPGCPKAYGTLNHLNSHKSMQKHGPKSTPAQFKELRKAWKEKKKKAAAAVARSRTRTTSLSPEAEVEEYAPPEPEPAPSPPPPPPVRRPVTAAGDFYPHHHQHPAFTQPPTLQPLHHHLAPPLHQQQHEQQQQQEQLQLSPFSHAVAHSAHHRFQLQPQSSLHNNHNSWNYSVAKDSYHYSPIRPTTAPASSAQQPVFQPYYPPSTYLPIIHPPTQNYSGLLGRRASLPGVVPSSAMFSYMGGDDTFDAIQEEGIYNVAEEGGRSM